MLREANVSEDQATIYVTQRMRKTDHLQAKDTREKPALWGERAPAQFDLRVAWWVKVAGMVGAILLAVVWVDGPVAKWVIDAKPLETGWLSKGDVQREVKMLEQYGQVVCTVVVIAAVALSDKRGRRRALAIGMACLLTVLATHLLKDCFGRARPGVAQDNPWIWGGPLMGFTKGSAWGSFPSAHTSGAFALSVALSWFYPRARGLLMGLALLTAGFRVLNHGHFVSDTLFGILLSVGVARWSLQAKLAGRLIAIAPPPVRAWWMQEQ